MTDELKLDVNDYLPLRDVVFQTLRRAILTGTLKPGERLMEIHLANQLGVSRTPVREAIRKLELEGLVIMIPRRGAEVANITTESMKDVLEVRRALDVLCTELSCERISEDDLKRLKAAADEFKQASQDEDITKIAACDVEFHDIILKATGNVRLINLVNNLSEQMYRYRFECIKDAGDCSELIKEHEMIYNAIEKHDKDTAAAAARLHIDNQEKAIMAIISKEVK